MKKVSVKIVVAALLLTSCSSMDMDEMQEEGLQFSTSEEERPPLMSGKLGVVSVCFMNYENVGIAAKLRCEGGDEQWTFPQIVSDVDKRGMAEAAHRVLQKVPGGLKYTMTCARPGHSICLYRAGFFSGENTRYRIIVVSEETGNGT